MKAAQLNNLPLTRLRTDLNRDQKECERKEKRFRKITDTAKRFNRSKCWALDELNKADQMMQTSKKLSTKSKRDLAARTRKEMIDKYVHSKLVLIANFSLSMPA